MHDPLPLLKMPNRQMMGLYIDLCLLLSTFISLSLGPIAMSNCTAGRHYPALLSLLGSSADRRDAAFAIYELQAQVDYR
jgi:hypothetical protein